MAKETEAILRSILFTTLRTDNVKEIRYAVMAMCSDDDIAAVKGHIAEMKEEIEEK
ncbi:MAG: hypothetical protein LBE35_00745 [Clostridiales bacterium]|jgi:hypothetical protein|nr:hypothetical protein [Clostridiales bacterium]